MATPAKEQPSAEPIPKYCDGLRAPLTTACGKLPSVQLHRAEWEKVMAGDAVEINPSIGSGYRVMSVDEWAARWKQNEDFPECLECGGRNTKEHYFTQTWCRGYKTWEAESLCLDCHHFSFRAYCDPDFQTPEQAERRRWEELASSAS